MKQCSKCRIYKPLTEFYKDKSKKTGIRSQCNVCIAEYDRLPERLTKRRKSTRIWYANNREYAKQKTYEWRDENPEAYAIHLRIWRAKHPEKSMTVTKSYQERHPEKVKQFRHARRARVRNAEGTFNGQEWIALKSFYNNTCLCCGKIEPEIILVPDHVVALSMGGNNYISNIQPLCVVCNAKKHTHNTDFRSNPVWATSECFVRQIGRIKFYNIDRDVEA